MRVALVIALCAMGCFSDRGVAIEVDVGDTGATSVELFIGKDACDSEANTAGIECGVISPPPDGATPLTGNVWFRDAASPYGAEVKGHTATFQLKSDTADKLPIVIAVGFTSGDQGQVMHPVGTATLRDLVIPVNTAHIARATLVGAALVQPEKSPAETMNLNEDRVMVWRKMTAPQSSCVAVEHWQRGQMAKRDFVVPVEDPDCDDVTMNECNPTAYRGMTLGGQAPNADCFAPGPAACALGSLACTDTIGPMPGTCAAQHDQVCVPSQFCACTSLSSQCTQPLIDNLASEVPRIVCHVPADGLLPGVSLCPASNTATIDLSMLFTTTCEQPLLGSLQPASLASSRDLTNSHDFGGAVMELSSPQELCKFQITWKSGVRPSIDAGDDHGVIKLQTGDHGLLLPIVLQFERGACATLTPFKCGVQGSTTDTLWSCAAP